MAHHVAAAHRKRQEASVSMADMAFTAYAEDCLVQGVLDLGDGVRLTDFLNETEAVPLTQVTLQALDDGRVVEVGDLSLDISEICAVEAPSGRGTGEHRIRTRVARVEIELGPYQLLGYLHGPTSSDPLLAISRRKPMIPITDATFAFTLAGQTRMVDLEVVIINRDQAHLVRSAKEEAGKIDEIGLSKVDPRARDFTPELTYGLGDH